MRAYEALISSNAILVHDLPHTQHEAAFEGRSVRHEALQFLYSILEVAQVIEHVLYGRCEYTPHVRYRIIWSMVLDEILSFDQKTLKSIQLPAETLDILRRILDPTVDIGQGLGGVDHQCCKSRQACGDADKGHSSRCGIHNAEPRMLKGV